jgi:hypothetical protein
MQFFTEASATAYLGLRFQGQVAVLMQRHQDQVTPDAYVLTSRGGRRPLYTAATLDRVRELAAAK